MNAAGSNFINPPSVNLTGLDLKPNHSQMIIISRVMLTPMALALRSGGRVSLLVLAIFALSMAFSGADVRQRVNALLEVSDYEGLDRLYEEFSSQQMELWNTYPDLLFYFDVLSPYRRQINHANEEKAKHTAHSRRSASI